MRKIIIIKKTQGYGCSSSILWQRGTFQYFLIWGISDWQSWKIIKGVCQCYLCFDAIMALHKNVWNIKHTEKWLSKTAIRGNCLLSNMNGGVCGTQAHNLNEFGAEQEPLSPVDPSGPHVYTQTNWRPSPTPLKHWYFLSQLCPMLSADYRPHFCLVQKKIFPQ